MRPRSPARSTTGLIDQVSAASALIRASFHVFLCSAGGLGSKSNLYELHTYANTRFAKSQATSKGSLWLFNSR